MKTDSERMLLAFLALTELRERTFWQDCNAPLLGWIDSARVQAVKRLCAYEAEEQRTAKMIDEARFRSHVED